MHNKVFSNFLKLLTGTGIAQLIPLIVAPILARQYGPEQFALLAIFYSTLEISSSFVGLKYEQSILVQESDDDAIKITIYTIMINFIISAIISIFLLLFIDQIVNSLKIEDSLKYWIFVLPILIFLLGVSNTLTFLLLRKKKFNSLAISSIVKSSSNNGIAVSLGEFYKNSGLLIGFTSSFFFLNFVLIIKSKDIIKTIRDDIFNVSDFKRLIKRFKDYPIFSMPSGILNTLSLNLNNFFINSLFDKTSLGFYSFSFKYINAPVTLISSTLQKVLAQRIAENLTNNIHPKKEFYKTLLILIVLSILGGSIMFFLVEDAFTFIFGEKWEKAGAISKILIPLICFRFIASPLSVLNQILEKQKVGLYINLILFIGIILIALIGYTLNISFESFLFLYSYIFAFLYFIVVLIEIYIIETYKLK